MSHEHKNRVSLFRSHFPRGPPNPSPKGKYTDSALPFLHRSVKPTPTARAKCPARTPTPRPPTSSSTTSGWCPKVANTSSRRPSPLSKSDSRWQRRRRRRRNSKRSALLIQKGLFQVCSRFGVMEMLYEVDMTHGFTCWCYDVSHFSL